MPHSSSEQLSSSSIARNDSLRHSPESDPTSSHPLLSHLQSAQPTSPSFINSLTDDADMEDNTSLYDSDSGEEANITFSLSEDSETQSGEVDRSLPSTAELHCSSLLTEEFEDDSNSDGVLQIEDEIEERADMTQTYIKEWVSSLKCDDVMSLSLLLHSLMANDLNVKSRTADELTGRVLNVSDRSVREWRSQFIKNDGCFPDTLQGKYHRDVVWQSEELNERATAFVCNNASVKGKPNLTAGSFCNWVNEVLLPSSVLEPGFPWTIHVETVRKWLHELGFSIINKGKGIYIDGHERDDVVAYQKIFLRRMAAIGFCHQQIHQQKLQHATYQMISYALQMKNL